MRDPQKLGRRLLRKQTTEEMFATATKFKVVVEGTLHVRGFKMAFDHHGIDFSKFRFEHADLSGSRWINCQGPGGVFRDCLFDDGFISTERGATSDFSGAEFIGCSFNRTFFGPRVLLEGCTFKNCRFEDSEFDHAKLAGSDCTRAQFIRTSLRGADLRNVNFTRTVFDSADLEKAVLTGAKLYKPKVRNMTLIEPG